MKLSLSLKILSLFYWWYLVAFVFSIIPILGIDLPDFLVPDFRGEKFAWDFELFFTSIAIVWAIFLWRSSRNPEADKGFISFTIWATFAHILAMIVVGVLRPGDLEHLLIDAIALGVPLVLVTIGYRKEFSSNILI